MNHSRSFTKDFIEFWAFSKPRSIWFSRTKHRERYCQAKIGLPLRITGLQTTSICPLRGVQSKFHTQQRLFRYINTSKHQRGATRSIHNARKTSYIVDEVPYGTKHPIKIIVIGAGVCGIDMMQTLKNYTTNISSIVYEKNSVVGGTWHENRYPGCASDDPSHSYQYTHTPNPKWSSVFAPAREIEKYLNDVVNANDIKSRIKCGYRVEKAEWDEKSGRWAVTVKEISTGNQLVDHAEVLIDASGIFNDWKWPELEGLQEFKGDLIHTANWPDNFEYRDKVIAVLGNGASGVQVVPAIQPHAKKLFHLIRSKTWISPPSAAVKFCHAYTGHDLRHFSKESIESFTADPAKYLEFQSEIDMLAAKDRFRTITNATESENARERITKYMTTALKSKPELIPMLIPSFPVGCRRPTASPSYIESLTAANVSVSNTPVEKCTASGIKLKDGEVINVDAIICATGFNTSFIPRFPLIGENGKNMQDAWREENGGPKAYLSIMVEGMPNYFRFIGPNGPLAHGAIPQLSSHICKYVLAHLQKLQIEHLTSIRPLPSAVEDFNEHIEAFLPRTAWAGKNCGGWYKSKGNGTKEGRVTTVHPGSQAHWEQMLKNVRWEDFEYRRRGENRFRYLGNGFAAVDNDKFKDDK